MEQFSERLLFGGAISTTFPIRFEICFVSRFRCDRFLSLRLQCCYFSLLCFDNEFFPEKLELQLLASFLRVGLLQLNSSIH
ncbi:hypothetical protein L1987_47153 [Smallanthus sonchifolius]|uniref:Uncharacterized protein n=1 Tax=Smallanthus sonchifolius TaxID=185202 RepID=A0ACB9G1M2_9ASTR|nr:hypothetical protein L1987_47153 [Smallanthus sonchifolius]